MNHPYFFSDSSSFQYTDAFQPLENSYNDLQGLGGHHWMGPGEEGTSPMPQFYDENPFPMEHSYIQTIANHNPILHHDSNLIAIAGYDATYSSPSSFQPPPGLPTYPQYPLGQYQPVEYFPAAHPTPLVILPPKSPTVVGKSLEWRNDDITSLEEGPKLSKKRKAKSTSAPAERKMQKEAKVAPATQQLVIQQPAMTSRSLEDCMGLFDTTLTATKEKRRRKVFSAQEKKVVKSVRNVGACIQCKFRKKTCSAGQPCPYCARLAGSSRLGTELCHRESPFIEKSLTNYYLSSSKKRILDFRLTKEDFSGTQRLISIDGGGVISHPLRIKIIECKTTDLGAEDLANVLRTAKEENGAPRDAKSLSKLVNFLDLKSLSVKDLEQWAFDYTLNFCKIKMPHATGFLFGIEYAARDLPHSNIVVKLTRLISINFILRAGITIIPDDDSNTPSPYRTIQAQVDALLFESFQATEKSLFRDLQRLIFRSAGSLARDAVVPVCLCVWQLSRLQCMLASQLTNLAANDMKKLRRAKNASLGAEMPSATNTPPTTNTSSTSKVPPTSFHAASIRSSPSTNTSASPSPSLLPQNPLTTPHARTTEARSQTHTLNLLLCTFEALFRGACPLLLDWHDPFSKELLQNDAVLLKLAERMGGSLRAYRVRGHSKKFKLGFGYDAEMSGRVRGLLREK